MRGIFACSTTEHTHSDEGDDDATGATERVPAGYRCETYIDARHRLVVSRRAIVSSLRAPGGAQISEGRVAPSRACHQGVGLRSLAGSRPVCRSRPRGTPMKTKTLNQGGTSAGALAVVFCFSVLALARRPPSPTWRSTATSLPSGAASGSPTSHSISRGDFRPAFGVIGDYAHAPYTLLNPDGTENTVVIQNAMYLHLGVAFVFAERLRLGLHLPIAVAQNGTSKTVDTRVFTAPSRGGVGDLRISADLRLAGEYGDPFTVALGGRLWVPTSVDSQYIGDNKVRIGPRLTFAGDIGTFVYAASMGAVYRADDTPLNGHPNGTEATFSAAIGLRVADRKLVLGPELYGSTVVTKSDAVFGARTTPMGMLVSLHYTAGPFLVGFGAGPGLSSTMGTPNFGASPPSTTFPRSKKRSRRCVVAADRDGDGVTDNEDACGDIPGVRTVDPRTNGCPADRDKRRHCRQRGRVPRRGRGEDQRSQDQRLSSRS